MIFLFENQYMVCIYLFLLLFYVYAYTFFTNVHVKIAEKFGVYK